MRTIFWIAGLAVIGFGGYYLFTHYSSPNADTMPEETHTSAPQIIPIEHATGILKWGDTAIYFDPTGEAAAFAGQPAANIVLLTDIHNDHLSTTTLASVVGPTTSIIAPQAVKDMLPADLAAKTKVLANDASLVEQGFSIIATPMYNLPGSDNANFHTKGRGNGYVIEKDLPDGTAGGVRVYIAGDTAGTPEMRAMHNIDIALIPMNLPYTMSVEEAADAVLAFKPKTVYPYHYRGQSGLSDVAKFKQLVNAGDPSINVVLANWYPRQ